MINKVNSIQLPLAIPVIIENTSQELITLNQDQLYYLGKDSEGNDLKPYSFLTEFYKREKNQPFDRTTLKDTGAFYRGWNIKTSDNLFTFDSTDPKTPMLEEKYGSKIFGLTADDKIKYSFGAFYDGIKKHITEKTGLQFS